MLTHSLAPAAAPAAANRRTTPGPAPPLAGATFVCTPSCDRSTRRHLLELLREASAAGKGTGEPPDPAPQPAD